MIMISQTKPNIKKSNIKNLNVLKSNILQSKIRILDKNWIYVKNRNFGKKIEVRSKIEICTKRRNLPKYRNFRKYRHVAPHLLMLYLPNTQLSHSCKSQKFKKIPKIINPKKLFTSKTEKKHKNLWGAPE